MTNVNPNPEYERGYRQGYDDATKWARAMVKAWVLEILASAVEESPPLPPGMRDWNAEDVIAEASNHPEGCPCDTCKRANILKKVERMRLGEDVGREP